jgi:hypothetical protein
VGGFWGILPLFCVVGAGRSARGSTTPTDDVGGTYGRITAGAARAGAAGTTAISASEFTRDRSGVPEGDHPMTDPVRIPAGANDAAFTCSCGDSMLTSESDKCGFGRWSVPRRDIGSFAEGVELPYRGSTTERIWSI